jgi:hypothetical protein
MSPAPLNSKEQYVMAEFKISAIIDEKTVNDIVAISANFALNSIPTATLTLACGLNTYTYQPATAHKLLASLRMRAPVKVFLEIKPTDGKLDKQKAEKILIFDGYYAGFGFQRANDHANYSLHLVHWLDDLNIGSMLSRNWFPNAPFSMAENASSVAEIEEDISDSPGGQIAPSFGSKYITNENVSENLWGKSLRPILEVIAGWPDPGEICGDTEMGRDPQTGGNLIKEALGRIIGDSTAAGSFGLGAHFVPLQLDLADRAGLDPVYFESGLIAAINNTGLAGYSYSTFWGKLVGEWGPMLFFAISPGVDFAQVVPFFAGNKDPYIEIEADEYGQAAFSGHMAQIIEGVDIIWPAAYNNSGVFMPRAERVPDPCTPLGAFPAWGERDKRGVVLVKEPPAWLQAYVDLAPASPDTTRLVELATTKTMAQLQEELKDGNACGLFAEHWYKNEVLQARYGEFSGKLRFDIAPGSTVKIKPPTKNMPMLPDNIDMYGMVTRVSFVINAERAQAGTAFAISHLRTEKENNDKKITGSITNNETPIYGKKWKGGPLVSNIAR